MRSFRIVAMIMLALAVAGLLAPQPALAFKRASDEDIKTIQHYLDEAAQLEGLINSAKAAGQDADAKKLQRDYVATWTRAIRKTLVAYGIVDEALGHIMMPTGQAVLKPFRGRTIQWIVVHYDRGLPRDVITPTGELQAYDWDPNAGSMTTSDGVTIVTGSFSVPALAANLLHESVHFKQFVTNGDQLTPSEAEFEAYWTEQKYIGDFGFTPERRKDWERDVDKWMAFYRKWAFWERRLGFLTWGSPKTRHARIEEAKLWQDPDHRAQLLDQARITYKVIDAEEREGVRAAWASESRDSCPAAGCGPTVTEQRMQAAPPACIRSANMYQLAAIACRNPGASPSDEDIGGYACDTDDSGDVYRLLSGPPSCRVDLANELMRVPMASITRDWLVSEASRLAEKYAPKAVATPVAGPIPQETWSGVDVDEERPQRGHAGDGCLPPDPGTGIVGCPVR
ncbi:MAG TPA: hypothetical protein VMH36_06790 [Alphaproteobacteria bacterium]|nr:hypothetical protein [Alphaproteobacteria bacterium]